MLPRTLVASLLVTGLSCAAWARAPAKAPVPAAAPPPKVVETVVIRPAELDDVLVNPGMGIQTFQRFDGQALDPGLTWSEEGPTSKLPDPPARPDYPGSSIAYVRWFWAPTSSRPTPKWGRC